MLALWYRSFFALLLTSYPHAIEWLALREDENGQIFS